MPDSTQHDSILRMPEVERICGIKRPTVYKYMRAGRFPQSVPLCGGRSVGWLESEIQAWIVSLAAQRPPTSTGVSEEHQAAA